MCQGLNLGLSVHVERDLVIKVQSKVRAAFAAGASGEKVTAAKLRRVREPRPSMF